jgi:hypothetical protein
MQLKLIDALNVMSRQLDDLRQVISRVRSSGYTHFALHSADYQALLASKSTADLMIPMSPHLQVAGANSHPAGADEQVVVPQGDHQMTEQLPFKER